MTGTSKLNTNPAHHAKKGGFRNPHLHEHHGLADLLKWAWQRRHRKPKKMQFAVSKMNCELITRNPPACKITWIGHSTFLLQLNGTNFLTDPHFSDRASPFSFAGPKRQTPSGLALEELPQIHSVLLSHNHYDHLDLNSLRRLLRQQPNSGPQFLVPLGLKKWFGKKRIGRVAELDWWQEFEFQDWSIYAVPAQHFSGRTPFDRNRTLWCGWILQGHNRTIYFAGDSGWFPGFGEIGRRFAPVDVSLIPVGAYEPRWFMRGVHLNPEEAVRVHRQVASRFSVGMHWGTFCLTDEDMDEPPRRLAHACRKAGVPPEQFVVLQHGETRSLDFLFENF